jgi:hypothetical protein
MGYYSYGEGVGWYEEPVALPGILYSSVNRRSNVLKALRAKWLTTPEGSTNVIISARGGLNASLDVTWTDWEVVTQDTDVSATLSSKPYLQYKVEILAPGVSLEWISFTEGEATPPEPVTDWGDNYSLYFIRRAFWLIHSTISRVNSRYRGWRESEKQNQFVLDLTYDLAKLFNDYETLLTHYLQISGAKTTDDYLLPTEQILTIYMDDNYVYSTPSEGETTNYTYWWGEFEDLRALQHIERKTEDWR